MNKRVLLGMSGGVDSSTSAIVLKEKGYEVVGATMRLWDNGKEESDEIKDAKNVCDKLGIEHHVIDLRKEFKANVIDNFICTYMCGKTPNPCVECNKFMKFDMFYKYAMELNCMYIATGHYAKIEYSEKYEQYVLTKSNEEKKDQTYFLYGINKEFLSHIILPLSEFNNKEEIRKIAEKNGLNVAKKKESQEVCFIPDNNYVGFLEKNQPDFKKVNKSGNIILNNGKILGKHIGIINYTVGQRKGLGISYAEPLYVIKLDTKNNNVIVGTEKELYSNILKANELNFLLDIDLSKSIEVKAKIRYRAKEADAILTVKDGIATLEFKEPQRAITPGQSVVFYIDDNIVLGGGKIV